MKLFFILLIVTHALIDAKRIEAGKIINHWLEGLIYGAIAALFWAISSDEWYRVVIVAIAFRMALFDILLNRFRGLPLLYEGTDSPNRSVVDRLEEKIGIPTIYLRIGYISLAVLIILFL